MARAYGDTADRSGPAMFEPAYAQPMAPERDFWEQPDLNEAVPRGDIIVAGPDDTGWEGSGPAIVTDDRPPAEAT